MTRFVKCRMGHRDVPERQTFLEDDGDRMCAHDRRCYRVALTRLGLKPHTAEFLSRRLYESAEERDAA